MNNPNNQQTAKFQDFLKPEVKAELSRQYVKVEPVYIRKLVSAVRNQTAVGTMLGLTGGGISGILSANATTPVNELAAQFIWERDFAEKKIAAKIEFAIISAEPHQLKTIKDLVAAISGGFQYLDLNKKD